MGVIGGGMDVEDAVDDIDDDVVTPSFLIDVLPK